MSAASPPVVGLVVPCYNEEAILAGSAARLQQEIEALIRAGAAAPGSRVLFVDDGSSDGTWSLIEALVESDGPFAGIRLTRNFGHQYALYAGLMTAPGDVLVSLDADLQDDPAVLGQMLAAYAAGNEIVYGVRSDRSTDTTFKRFTAALHYRLTSLLGVQTIADHADFRLMSRRAVSMLSRFREANLYLRGIVPLIGLRSCTIPYRRNARGAGSSKYNLGRMLSLSLRGLTSFSIMPLRLIAVLGVLVFVVSVVMGLWALGAVLFTDRVVPGWASTVIPVYLLGGLQLLGVGVVGEYIGKCYMEIKQRPQFLIDGSCGLTESVDDRDGGGS